MKKAATKFDVFCIRYFSETSFVKNIFLPVTGLECSYGKIFILVAKILVVETEISVTGLPAFSYEHRAIFTKEKGVRRDRGNLASLSQPGSYEEALTMV